MGTATEAETAALVGYLRTARNPQRERRRAGGYSAGSVNPKTGKLLLARRVHADDDRAQRALGALPKAIQGNSHTSGYGRTLLNGSM
jgi:hypothetical protein